MHDSDLLSIIVPVYNEAGTVQQVIERLLEIPLPLAREIVVVNDGSTDGTTDVLNRISPVPGMKPRDFAQLTMPVLVYRSGKSDLSHTRATSEWVHRLIPTSGVM